jgi:hypothetical protein
MQNMCSRDQSKWDASRFLATLNYFGEVPFLGSFRWLQRWLGQTSVVSGMTLNTQKKKIAIIGVEGSAHFNELQIHQLQTKLSLSIASSIAPSIEVQFYDWQNDDWPNHLPDDLSNDLPDDPQVEMPGSGDASHPRFLKLQNFMREADALAVLNVTNHEGLIPYLGDFFEKIPQKVLKEILSSVEISVFDFSNAEADLSAWGALDDVVMGGVSQGRFFKQTEQAVFAGNVSTSNSGGFSSVRTRNFEPPFDFSTWRGLRLRVRGDGQRYKFILRNSDGWDSPAYIYGFNTSENVWMDVEVPFDELVPTFRARSVPNAPTFDRSRVFSFQLMLSKFEIDRQLNPQFTPGPFELAVRQITAYRERQGVPLILVGKPNEATYARLQTTLEEAKVPYRLIEVDATDADKMADAIAQALIDPKP